MTKNLFVILIFILAQGSQLFATENQVVCVNSKKHFDIENSGTEITGITSQPSGSIILESPNGNLSLDCDRSPAGNEQTSWKSVRRETGTHFWEYLIPVWGQMKLNQDLGSRTVDFHDSSEFPLNTEVTVTSLGKATAIFQINSLTNPTAKKTQVVCNRNGVSIFSVDDKGHKSILFDNNKINLTTEQYMHLPDLAGVSGCPDDFTIDVASGSITKKLNSPENSNSDVIVRPYTDPVLGGTR